MNGVKAGTPTCSFDAVKSPASASWSQASKAEMRNMHKQDLPPFRLSSLTLCQPCSNFTTCSAGREQEAECHASAPCDPMLQAALCPYVACA